MMLHGKNVLLRPPLVSDAAGLVRELNNLRVTRWLARVPHPYTEADAQAFLKVAVGAPPFSVPCVILRASDAHLVGGMGVDEGRLGYWVGESHWGQGYASEAAELLLQHAFTTSDLASIRASYMEGNIVSAHILSKLGFIETGRLMIPSLSTGQSHPGIELELTRKRWFAQQTEALNKPSKISDV